MHCAGSDAPPCAGPATAAPTKAAAAGRAIRGCSGGSGGIGRERSNWEDPVVTKEAGEQGGLGRGLMLLGAKSDGIGLPERLARARGEHGLNSLPACLRPVVSLLLFFLFSKKIQKKFENRYSIPGTTGKEFYRLRLDE